MAGQIEQDAELSDFMGKADTYYWYIIKGENICY